MQALLQAGADVNLADDKGRSPLLSAASGLDGHIVELLLEAGADVNQADDVGHTALSKAAANESLSCVKLLLAAGANANMPGRFTEMNNNNRWNQMQAVQFFPPDWDDLDLKNQCRKVIRKYLLTLDPHTNLFVQIGQLQMTHERAGLPEKLVSYLLFGQSLSMDLPGNVPEQQDVREFWVCSNDDYDYLPL